MLGSIQRPVMKGLTPWTSWMYWAMNRSVPAMMNTETSNAANAELKLARANRRTSTSG